MASVFMPGERPGYNAGTVYSRRNVWITGGEINQAESNQEKENGKKRHMSKAQTEMGIWQYGKYRCSFFNYNIKARDIEAER